MMHLGIDLSKAYFDATLRNEQGQKTTAHFDNTPTGFVLLDEWLKAQGVSELHGCMEATNVYWEPLAHFLHGQGYTVSVVNPARIKGFAMSQLRRNKTDKQDSDVIVDFCEALTLKAWTPPSAEVNQLRHLVRLRATLIKTLTQQKNRHNDAQDETVKACWQRLIDTLEREIAQVESPIEQQIAQHPALHETATLLRSIKGFGPIVTWTIMAEMPDLAEYEDAHAAAADAGVNPAHHESGETVRHRPKLSKVGKAAIRGVLYLPALTALKHNPIVRTWAERLALRGKPKKLIIVAAMRKLLHLAYGVLKNKKPFDPDYAASPLPAT
jgi:transposase